VLTQHEGSFKGILGTLLKILLQINRLVPN